MHKYVVITGASSGIGRALSECFAAEGADLCLGCHPLEKQTLIQWSRHLGEKYGVRSLPIAVDLSGRDGPEKLYRQATAKHGEVDVLVNNAGVISYGAFHSLSLAQQEKMILVNAMAYFRLMRLFLPAMVGRGSGRVLNVSSTAAFQPTAHHAVYGATKAFVQSLSEAVHTEVKGSGVKVMTLNPSYTDTPMLHTGGFPKKIWWYSISGLGSPEAVAQKAVSALKRGRLTCIPGFHNRLIHTVLPRILPRAALQWISYRVLMERK